MGKAETASERERRLAWEGCLNARDVGGYATRDGGVTRWGAVVRSDSPSLLTRAGQEALEAYGIRTAIDLRFPHELDAAPNPFSDPAHPIDYVHVSLIDPDDQAVPGETMAGAWLDLARVVARRAERDALPVAGPPSHTGVYLNRLSDLLWTMARWQESRSGQSRPSRSITSPEEQQP